MDRLAVVAGYAYNTTRLSETSGLGAKGDWYANAPHLIGNARLSYQAVAEPTVGLTLGAGGRVVSERLGVIQDQRWFRLPGYTLVDAAANLRVGGTTLSATVTNALNARWFPGGYYSRVLVIVGDPRSFRLALTRRF